MANHYFYKVAATVKTAVAFFGFVYNKSAENSAASTIHAEQFVEKNKTVFGSLFASKNKIKC